MFRPSRELRLIASLPLRAIWARMATFSAGRKAQIERSLERFDLYPNRLLGDSSYGSAECSASWSTSRGSSHTVLPQAGITKGAALDRSF